VTFRRSLNGVIWRGLASIDDERLIVAPGLYSYEIMAVTESGKTVWGDAERRYKGWRSVVT